MWRRMQLRVAVGLLVLAGCLASAKAQQAKSDPRIEWQYNVYQAYRQAVDQHKPLVIYFRQDYCETCGGICKHCSALETVLRNPRIQAFGNDAIYVWQNVEKDDDHGNVAKLKRELGIDRVPAVVVLEANKDSLREKGRIVGTFPAEEFAPKLLRALTATPAVEATK